MSISDLTVAVLGNGPSLATVDPTCLDVGHTIGMNAAYRFWERIGWFPDYYSCLDDVVVESHAGAIAEMLLAGLYKGAFLSGRFFELHPEFRDQPNLLNLDRVSWSWFQTRGVGNGQSFIYHPAFTTCFPWITTGSWTIRWAAFLGFSRVHLYGFDLTYQEQIKEVSSLGGIRLRVDSPIEDNPNYFFPDYQRAGDEFQVANPPGVNRELHVDAVKAVVHDFGVQGVGTELFNGQSESGLAGIKDVPMWVGHG